MKIELIYELGIVRNTIGKTFFICKVDNTGKDVSSKWAWRV